MKINPVIADYLSSLRSRAEKVVEFCGLLLGFIVLAAVNFKVSDYTGISYYLSIGFFLTLGFLFLSVILGLYVLLNDDYEVALDKGMAIKSLERTNINLRISILFCNLGLFWAV